MALQVELLRDLNRSLESACVLDDHADKKSLRGTQYEPFSPDVVAFSVK
jgi:hypothetical protein